MRITDYETNRELRDVRITLTREEVGELCEYLTRMCHEPSLPRVFLSEISGAQILREITVVVDEVEATANVA